MKLGVVVSPMSNILQYFGVWHTHISLKMNDRNLIPKLNSVFYLATVALLKDTNSTISRENEYSTVEKLYLTR